MSLGIPEICPRCRTKPICTVMSRFNTQVICCDCEEIERQHPAYAAAAAAELAAVRSGNWNFSGVGAPPDLIAFTRQRRGLS